MLTAGTRLDNPATGCAPADLTAGMPLLIAHGTCGFTSPRAVGFGTSAPADAGQRRVVRCGFC